MTIEDAGTIDLVAAKGGRIALIVTDHLGWSDYPAHAARLRQKVDVYVGFVESGELWEDRKLPPAVQIVIELALKAEPPAQAAELFTSLEDALQRRGFGFELWVGQLDDTRRMSAPTKLFEDPR